MINVIPTSLRGETFGAWALIKLMQDNPKELVRLYEIEKADGDTSDYTFLALFREKGTIGQFVAFVNQWGTNFGPREGGTGGSGYREMRSFLADAEIEPETIDWESISEEMRKRLESASVHVRLKAWEEFLIEDLPNCMLNYLEAVQNYPINEQWARKSRGM